LLTYGFYYGLPRTGQPSLYDAQRSRVGWEERLAQRFR
jgi:hypothetical protein